MARASRTLVNPVALTRQYKILAYTPRANPHGALCNFLDFRGHQLYNGFGGYFNVLPSHSTPLHGIAGRGGSTKLLTLRYTLSVRQAILAATPFSRNCLPQERIICWCWDTLVIKIRVNYKHISADDVVIWC